MRMIALLLIAFALPVFLFPTLHRVHPYYGLENGVFLLAAVAVLLSRLSERAKVIATMGVMALQVITFETVYRPMLLEDDGSRALGAFIEAHTQPDDVLLIYGQEWNPENPYYAHRKAIMETTLAPPNTVVLHVNKQGDQWLCIYDNEGTCHVVHDHVGAVIDCRGGPCQIRFSR